MQLTIVPGVTSTYRFAMISEHGLEELLLTPTITHDSPPLLLPERNGLSSIIAPASPKFGPHTVHISLNTPRI